MSTDNLSDLIEALLFASAEPLTAKRMADIAQVKEREMEEALHLLMEERDRVGGLRIIPVAGGYRMVTKPQFAAHVAKLRPQPRARLSRAALETLTIVAYRQPITRAEIDFLRGVDSSGALETLLERNLIEVVGQKETAGRPRLYGTTQQFLDQFALRSLDDLPPLKEVAPEQVPRALFERQREVIAPDPQEPLQQSEERHEQNG
ncbi:MAG: SMC-Scp complex subunit ScpB [Abditibacteriales bacterium]|nr:SMC-Scp complex subunit ScpB [Abditibacteriales bacterium]MDW8368261.1 SMC-Scp complex subunit ScpB [Abditibacteriales bacterium]